MATKTFTRVEIKDVEHRFWVKVHKTTECWLWVASTFGGGYGQFSVNGRKQYAHRYAYELLVGPIPEGHELDHLCRVRHCVNPAHLEPVSHRENILRGESWAARHAVKTHCPAGHEYADRNLFYERGSRRCRTCRRDEQRRRRAEKRVA